MELVVSAVAGELVNRFMSFLFNQYKSEEQLEKKMKRLQDLVVRAHMIVEEAEVRYITNSKMLLQLKKLVEVMYQGYLVLDTNRYRTVNKVSSTFSELLSFTTRTKRPFTTCVDHELQPTLDNLESVVSNMKEFVFLLQGCERMFRSPYDSYLCIDNFLFGRHTEKQQIINILLQDNPPPFTPSVLPVIGGVRVGKKTLIAHVCSNEKIRSQFSSVLHLTGENIWTMEHDDTPAMPTGKSLLVVHFAADVEDEVWHKFYSSAAKKWGRGSKIIIVSKIRMLSRLGTVQPIYLNSLSRQEYSYLFKVLAFGSTNPEEHPRLASVAQDLAEALSGSLVTANLYAHLLRKNQHVDAWLRILQNYRNVVENNMSIFGVHPKNLMDKEHPIYITSLVPLSSPPRRLRLMPPHRGVDASNSKGRLPKVMLGDLIVGSTVLPKEDFEVVVWESRIAPYKRFVHLATYCGDEEPGVSSHTASSSRKRRRLDK